MREIKQHHIVRGIIGTTIVIVAWLLARGSSLWLAASIFEGDNATVAAIAPPPTVALLASARTSQHKDGTPILHRNFFDPSTGPLDGTAQTLDIATPQAPVDPNAPPPLCSGGGKLVGVLYAKSAPEQSFVSIKTGGESAKVFQVGDSAEGGTVKEILSNAVYIQQSGRVCQLQMFEDVFGAAPPTPVAAGTPSAPITGATGSLSDQELKSGIRKISDTQYQISRSLLSKILENQANLTAGVRVTPQTAGGATTGVKIFRLTPGNVLSMIGLQNGDELRSINGYNIGEPKSALEAYAKLQTADRLTVQVVRGGSPTTFEYKIQ